MNIQPIIDATIAHAAELLRSGRLVAFPTETVYGLGADAMNGEAVAEIFAVKGRPQFNPLILHVSDVVMAKRVVAWSKTAGKLAARFWPGPLTLVLPRLPNSRVSLLASAGGDTLGVRMPSHEAARAMIAAAEVPVAAPSANRSGRISPTTARHVYEELGNDVPLILDGGACKVGIESTVIDLSGNAPVLLRPGSVTREQIEAVLFPASGDSVLMPSARAKDVPWDNGTMLKSPGQLASHYAPSLPLRLNATQPLASEALLAFGNKVPRGAKTTFNLSASGNLKEAAAHLFALLRALDRPEHMAIAVMPIPEEGLGAAINDRLKRAAARDQIQ